MPGAGKTTFRNHLTRMHSRKGWAIISSDDIIETLAKRQRKTYDELYEANAKEANDQVHAAFLRAISMRQPVIIDRTNLSKASRANWLTKIPKTYKIVGVIIKTPDKDEHKKRLGSRPGKTIPEAVLERMRNSFEYPTLEEGFSTIYEWPQEIVAGPG